MKVIVMTNPIAPASDIEELKKRTPRPEKVLVTGGMPYANGPLHLGHLAGALIPPDIFARYMRMLIGADNVLFVSGNDDHGSTSELAALKAGVPIRTFIDTIHEQQCKTLSRYSLALDVFSGTSRPECFEIHSQLCQDFIRKLHSNGMLQKRVSQQWYDTQLQRFLQDRFVNGKCPNPKCDNLSAYSDQCEKCGLNYDPSQLLHPVSTLSQSVPELRNTTHWWLDLWKVSEPLRLWIQSKEKLWRSSVYTEVLGSVLPALVFANTFEEQYKLLKEQLPKHKSKYAAGKKVQLQFECKRDLLEAESKLHAQGFSISYVDGWAHRSISRDVPWGIALPMDLDSDMKDKTFYVWPDSLIAPISFTQVALKNKGHNSAEYIQYWKNPKAKIYQFLGQDNVYFYVLMQGAMWFGQLSNPQQMPQTGDFQLTEIFGSYHLWVNGEKMSKSSGNFYSGDQLLDEMKYSSEQIRYFLATLNLSEKNSNFDLTVLNEKNKFLAGPMNAAFERPLSACHSKFNGVVPEGILNEKVVAETFKLVQRYLKSMEKSDFPVLLGQIENYARQINSLFTQHKPHDDRHSLEERANALYTCFYVLKNLMIMLYPFVPVTMNKLRQALNLPESHLCIEELGRPITAGHRIGELQEFFSATEV
jgi:methionyl-tRNA synthetase